jgi:hypothetical protein
MYHIILRPRPQFSIYLSFAFFAGRNRTSNTFYICFYYLFFPPQNIKNIITFKFWGGKAILDPAVASKKFEGELKRSFSPLDMIAFAFGELLEKECRISILKLAIWKVFSFFLVLIHDVECLWSCLMQRAGLQTSGNQK